MITANLRQENINKIVTRIGGEHLDKRLQKQEDHYTAKNLLIDSNINFENLGFYPTALDLFLKMFLVRKKAGQNTINYKVEEVDVFFEKLPESFNGFRVLQLSDLHIESIIDKGERLKSVISGIDFDLCVITGDFRGYHLGEYMQAIICMKTLVSSLQCENGILGVLGNHDFIEMTPELEEIGVKILLNESVCIERDNERIWIVGVDDPHYYETHDLGKAMRGIPEDEAKILLAHSPEMADSSAVAGINYYICGHTHGGQICMPNGRPFLTNIKCKRGYVSGAWRCNGMNGYTSRGTGSSVLPARIFCPPEITVHRLVSGHR